MGKFWEGLSGEAGKDWLSKLQTPAFAFWATGLLLLLWQLYGYCAPEKVEDWIKGAPAAELAVLAVAVLILVAVSGWVVDTLTLSLLRLLEGYWPAWLSFPLTLRIERHRDLYRHFKEKRDALLVRQDRRDLNWVESLQLAYFEERVREFPDAPEIMGTRLGNILRAAEARPRLKYGLDGVICWSRLWLLLSDDVRQELSSARASLDDAARLWLWGLLMLVWAYWQWWIALVALTWMAICYRTMLAAARVYGDLLEAVYDVKRGDLYEALSWPRPANAAAERQEGQKVTDYLWSGVDGEEPVFTFATKKPDSYEVLLRWPEAKS